MREFEEFWPTGTAQQKGDISSKCSEELAADLAYAADQLGMKPAKLIRIAIKYFLLERAASKVIKLKHITAEQLNQLRREQHNLEKGR